MISFDATTYAVAIICSFFAILINTGVYFSNSDITVKGAAFLEGALFFIIFGYLLLNVVVVKMRLPDKYAQNLESDFVKRAIK